MFPIAWVIIDKENTGNWRWFFVWLAQDLELGDGLTLIIISNIQKVLLLFINCILFFNLIYYML